MTETMSPITAVGRQVKNKRTIGVQINRRERENIILFKQEHVQPILNDIKTQTRRTGKLRWKVGAIRQAKTGYKKDSEFAKLHIKSIRQEALGLITEADALAEGYNCITEYKEVFERIYGFWNDDLVVHVIDFERVTV